MGQEKEGRIANEAKLCGSSKDELHLLHFPRRTQKVPWKTVCCLPSACTRSQPQQLDNKFSLLFDSFLKYFELQPSGYSLRRCHIAIMQLGARGNSEIRTQENQAVGMAGMMPTTGLGILGGLISLIFKKKGRCAHAMRQPSYTSSIFCIYLFPIIYFLSHGWLQSVKNYFSNQVICLI